MGRLKWDINSEIQSGLGWRMCLICAEGCGYHSNMHNLYEGVKTSSPHTGPKAVAANIGFQMAANMSPTSARAMQQTMNNFCDAITVLNEDDMAKQC